jgi:eukaryotic-like serine/threonine-protein kinase
MIGTKLGHYEITSHLGSGGMGEVYQATDTKLGRSVAIKFLPEAFSHDTERVARFQREARVVASLNHPNTSHRRRSTSYSTGSRTEETRAGALVISLDV